jgi:hypothetical protein
VEDGVDHHALVEGCVGPRIARARSRSPAGCPASSDVDAVASGGAVVLGAAGATVRRRRSGRVVAARTSTGGAAR